MPHYCYSHSDAQTGFVLLEALITIVILAFGLLGLAGLQAKIQLSQSESFQRAQAILLVQDMANRLSADRGNATEYLTNSDALGTGDDQPADCSTLTARQRNLCEWSNALKGVAESTTGPNFTRVAKGAMVGARGCIERISTNPAVYRITTAWQGLTKINAPSVGCGQGEYGEDSYRRAIVRLVTVGDLSAL